MRAELALISGTENRQVANERRWTTHPGNQTKRIIFPNPPYTQEFIHTFSLQLCALYIRRDPEQGVVFGHPFIGDLATTGLERREPHRRKTHALAGEKATGRSTWLPNTARAGARLRAPGTPKSTVALGVWFRDFGVRGFTSWPRHRGEWKSRTFAKTPFPPDGWYVAYSWVDWAGDDRCTTCSLPPRALRHPSRAVPLVPTTRWSAHIKRTELKKMMGPSGRCPALSRSTPGWGRT